jgi:hypothetical protein
MIVSLPGVKTVLARIFSWVDVNIGQEKKILREAGNFGTVVKTSVQNVN